MLVLVLVLVLVLLLVLVLVLVRCYLQKRHVNPIRSVFPELHPPPRIWGPEWDLRKNDASGHRARCSQSKARGYFCTVNGTENSVFSQTMLKPPPLEGSLETAIVN